MRMLPWSPIRQLHHHHYYDPAGLAEGSLVGDATDKATSWLPAAEGRIEDGAYVVQLVLPGVDPKDITLSWVDNVLTVKGERKARNQATDGDYFVREVAYGTFQRDFAFPEGVDASGVEANYAQGMLEVKVPKPHVATPKKIEIRAA